MPFVLGIIYAAFLMYILAVVAYPVLTSWITALFMKKAARLDEMDKIWIGVSFYLVMGLLHAFAVVYFYEWKLTYEVLAFVGMLLFWPFAFGALDFNQSNHGDYITGGILISSFIICQIIAIMLVIRRTRIETERFNMDI